jgi:hypothetical protein
MFTYVILCSSVKKVGEKIEAQRGVSYSSLVDDSASAEPGPP